MMAASADTRSSKTDPDEPLRRSEHATAEEVEEFLSDLGTNGEVKFELFRRQPPSHRGIKTDGHLRNYFEPFTIEEVQQEHGGGKFQVRCNRRTINGRWGYAGARTFDIAGVPKIDSLRDPDDDDGRGKNGGSTDPAVGQALLMARNLVDDAREQARDAETRASSSRGMDEGTRMMIDNMQETMRSMADRLEAANGRILELVGRPPDNTREDKLFDIMRDSNTDHSSRITELRTAHDTELRTLREFHRDELRRREDRFEKELDAMRATHGREIESLKESHRTALESQKNAYEMRIDTLKDQKKSLERDLNEYKSEIGSLRAKKELSPLDQLNTIVALKNGMESVFPTASDDEPSKLQQVLGTVMESPLVQSIAGRIEGSAGAGGGEQMVQVRDQKGNIRQVPASYIEQMRAQQAQQQGGNQPQQPAVDPADVQRAIGFLEAAYQNGNAPDVVAAAARSVVPPPLLGHLRRVGVDAFLEQIGVSEMSPLSSVAGRMWVRQLASVLLGGDPGPAPDPAQPPETPAGAPDAGAGAEDLDFDADAALDDDEGPAVQ